MRQQMLFAALLVLSASFAHAEHRVALLVENSSYQDEPLPSASRDIQTVRAALEKYGVNCTVIEDLDRKHLEDRIERFVDSTPTRGLALVYFRGHVVPARGDQRDTLLLTATDADRSRTNRIGKGSYSVRDLLTRLNHSGGSSVNLVLIDSPEDVPQPANSMEQPGLIAAADAGTLATRVTGNGELITEIQSASEWSLASFPSGTAVMGRGSSVVCARNELATGRQAGQEWVNRRGMVFCWCPPGRFSKGSPPDEPGRYPDEQQSEVIIEDGFWIEKYELTLRESMRKPFANHSIARHKNHPVTHLKRADYATRMLRELTKSERKAERLPDDWEYALPTEEQWEYAARAGTTTPWYFGSDVTQLPEYANFADKSWYDTKSVYSNAAHQILDDGVVRLSVVGRYRPNPWGLHDVHGNVAEHCWNPTPAPRGSFALRGGGWASTPEYCRCAFRNRLPKDRQTNFAGYRVVIRRLLPEPQKKSGE